MEEYKKLWLGKEVQIYPGDTYSKYGKIVNIIDGGITFLITKSNERDYIVGKNKFISFSNKLSFSEK